MSATASVVVLSSCGSIFAVNCSNVQEKREVFGICVEEPSRELRALLIYHGL
jgi:hypothetical protein